MEKKLLAAASFYKQKYYFSPEFQSLPKQIQNEVKIVCVLTAQKLFCTFSMGFSKDGVLYFETILEDGEIDFDEIGAELMIKELKKEKKELFQSIQIWYDIFHGSKSE